MQGSNLLKKLFFPFLFLGILFSSCTKEKIETINAGNTIFQIDTVAVYQSGTDKKRIKSPAQFIGILYTDLFATGISSKELNELSLLSQSIGDKNVFAEMVLENYLSPTNLNHPTLILPTDAEMRKDMTFFVNTTYLRFFARKPSVLESEKIKSMIQADPKFSVPQVYKAFCLSAEYQYY